MSPINDSWKFAKLPELNISDIKDTTELDLSNITMDEISIPHTWYEDGNAYNGAVIYTRKFNTNVLSQRHIFLQFEAADRWCRVYINKTFVGEHKGGYAAFAFDITRFCTVDEANELVVLLDNRSWDIISPLAGDFTVFGGIYRNVNIIEVPDNCFDRTYFGTDGVIACTDIDENKDGLIKVSTYMKLENTEGLSLRYVVRDESQNDVLSETSDITADVVKKELVVKNPVLWNGQANPAMYGFGVELIKDGKVIDKIEKLIGFRKVTINAQTGFFINGEITKINGVAKHQDFAEVFNATNECNWKKDLADLQDIGANSVRLSHYQHPQKMYELCDKEGLIVWAEIPFLKISETKEFFDNACQQLKELILQNMHHPSICFWGVQNEIAMFAENETTYEYVEELNALVKELDDTRISACANLFCVKNDSKLNRLTDAVGYNIYFGWYYGKMKDNDAFVEAFHKENPNVPLGITEYGVDCNLKFHNSNPKVKDYSEEFQALYHETVYPIFKSKSYIWGTYVWNLYDFSSSVRDEGGVKYKNCKGLITYDRKIKKDAYYYYKAQWSKETFVQIAEKRFANRVAGKTDVKVYSNANEVTLTIENKDDFTNLSVSSNSGVFIFENVKLGYGDNVVKAYTGDVSDEAIFNGQEEADKSYTFIDSNPGINVKNWFIDALEEEKMFPKGKYSIRDSSTELLKSDKAMAVLEEFNFNLAQQMRDRQGAMPLERILNYMKKEVTDEQCKLLNEKLIQIDK